MTKRSPATETLADAGPASWADASVEAVVATERLAPDQPDHGLLWVTRGSLTLERGGRLHEVRKGTVIAYRVGGGLTWSAVQGTHVRWCAREVGVGPGQVAPWTSDLALDGPVPSTQRRRPAMLAATVAMAWLFAIGVAWCYDRAHAARIRTETGTAEGFPSPEFAERLQIEMARQIFIERMGGFADIVSFSKTKRLTLRTDAPDGNDLSMLVLAAREAADDVYRCCPSIRTVLVAFGASEKGDLPEATGRYFSLPAGGEMVDMRWSPDPKAATPGPSPAASESASRAPEGSAR